MLRRTSLAQALRLLATSVGIAACAGTALVASRAEASSPYLEIPDPAAVMETPAYRYANMSDAEAYAELDRRNILYSRVASASGVRAPIRLTGRLHGVLIRSALPPEERAGSIFEICDARLALALDDFAAILERHDVEEVVHFTMYRPNVPPPGAGGTSATDVASTTDAKSGAQAGSTKAGDGRHTPRAGKRRAFLDEKGSKGSKTHASAAHGPAASGESRRKEPFGLVGSAAESSLDRETLRIEEPVLFGKGAGDFATSDTDAKTGPQKDKPAGHPGIAPTPKKWGRGVGAKPSPLGVGSKPGASKGAAAAFDDEQPHGTWAPPGTRHPAGLAIDVGFLKKKNGKILSVASNFGGKLGERTCGAGAPVPDAEEARELRSIVCEAHDAGVFTYTLTPNYNVAHRDHFHMEIKPGVVWFLYN